MPAHTDVSIETILVSLRRIDKEIRSSLCGGYDAHLRKIDWIEWEEITRIVQEYDLPCTLDPAPVGFDLNIYVCKEARRVKPNLILRIHENQFPFSSTQRGVKEREEALLRLSYLTHRKRNRELLEFYGFNPLGDPRCYAD